MSTDKPKGVGPHAGQRASDAAANATATDASSNASKNRANLYTHHAEQAVNVAELINSAFKKRVLGSVVPRYVEVASPSGPSTSGGKKARQSITLAQSASQAPSVMIGFLDVAQKSAGMREYELVARQYEARFRLAFETTREDYQTLTQDLAGMLAALGYKLEPDEPREEGRSSVPAPAPVTDNKKPFMIAGAMVLGALFCLLLTRC